MTLRKQSWINFRSPLIYIPVLFFILLVYVSYLLELNIYSIKLKKDVKIFADNGFLIKTEGCRIPMLDPFDESVLQFIYKEKQFSCGNSLPLVESDLDEIYINYEHLTYYNTTTSEVSCYYQPFWRRDPKTKIADKLYIFGNYTYFNDSIKITDEFIKVICKVDEKIIYTDFHSFVPIKKENVTKEKLNVLIIGLDAISRLNFERQLPMTKKYLEKLNAIEMAGYNKVGDNTFPNLIPVLSGQTEKELAENCWHTQNTKFDNCYFIWQNYSQAGYLTAFAEDSSWMGLFNYLKSGFHKQPTDYYWRTFNYLAEKEIGHNKPCNAKLCIGLRPTYVVLFDYIQKFVLSLKDHNYFSLFWETSLSHDYLNYPSMADKYYNFFFENLEDNNILNNTILVMMSDHGIRWGGIRTTYQGHLEERLPFLFFIFPPWFNKEYPRAIANMQKNTKRLTTPFDLHETFLDLLNMESLSEKNIEKRSVDLYKRRGISLFLPVPENRTCTSANISVHWCTCQTRIILNKNSTIVKQVAEFVINHINWLLREHNGCAALKLDAIIDSRLSTSQDYLLNNLPIKDYTVIFRTQPGDGLFEATVRCLYCESLNFNLMGTISRLNLYGNKSACIKHYRLKLYCFCIN